MTGVQTCALPIFNLILPYEGSLSQTYQIIEDVPETYQIARWSKDSIESYPLGSSTDCRNTSLNFNFKTKEFYFLTRNAGGDCKLPLGGVLPRLTKPRISQIVEGEKIIDEKFAEIEKSAYNVLSSAFRKQFDALSQQDQSR